MLFHYQCQMSLLPHDMLFAALYVRLSLGRSRDALSGEVIHGQTPAVGATVGGGKCVNARGLIAFE